jgi:hypothetical protein
MKGLRHERVCPVNTERILVAWSPAQFGFEKKLLF